MNLNKSQIDTGQYCYDKFKLFYFRDIRNFGDELNGEILHYLGVNFCYASIDQTNLLAIGSLLSPFIGLVTDVKPSSSSYEQNMDIWGTGFIEDKNCEKEYFTKTVSIHALRGKLSKERCENILGHTLGGIALGDPGLLVSRAIHVNGVKKYDVGIIPHYVDKASNLLSHIQLQHKSYKVIDIQGNATQICREICECRLILSSALHGLIAADSYGVPNRWIKFSDNIVGGNYKFNDYYSVFDIEGLKPIELRKGIITDRDIDLFIADYPIKQKYVEIICNDLEKSFPRRKVFGLPMSASYLNKIKYENNELISKNKQAIDCHDLVARDLCNDDFKKAEVKGNYSCLIVALMHYVFSKFKNIISIFKLLPSIVRHGGGTMNSVKKVWRILLSKGWNEAKQRILIFARDQNIMVDKNMSVSISMPKFVFCGERVFSAVLISNSGDRMWDQPVSLSYHIYGADGALLQWDGLRTPIDIPIAPGVTKSILGHFDAPELPGKFRLEWDLLVEGNYWFSHRGKSPTISHIEAVEAPIIENVQPIIVKNVEIKYLNVVIAVRTWNLIRTRRLSLFQQTIASLELAGYPHKRIIFDNGSCDGTADLIRDMGGYTLPPDESIDNPGRGMNLAIEKALSYRPDIIVFSDDDMAWHPGFLCALVKFWSCAPTGIAILSGFIEPRYAWSKAYGIMECNGVRVLLTSNAPGCAWTFRAIDWKNIAPLPEDKTHDVWGCAALRAKGRQLCQADLAFHLGADNSICGNMHINTSKTDLDRLGLRYYQPLG